MRKNINLVALQYNLFRLLIQSFATHQHLNLLRFHINHQAMSWPLSQAELGCDFDLSRWWLHDRECVDVFLRLSIPWPLAPHQQSAVAVVAVAVLVS